MSDQPGDTINVGNISNSPGTAIGPGASVHYHQITPTRPDRVPAFQVPFLPAPLIGRTQELETLATMLLNDAPVVLTPAITGMGGVGKTLLAATFARQYQQRFPGGVFWLSMEQPEGIAVQVANCAGPAGLDLPGYDVFPFEERIERVKAAWKSAEHRLLVFDNLEDPALLKTWQPTGGGSRVLITTRRDDWPRQVQRLRLPVLPRIESLKLLLGARAEEQGRSVDALLAQAELAQKADQICEILGDLPLALAIAAAYLRQHPSLTLQHYYDMIAVNPLGDEADPSMSDVLVEAGLPTGRERSILATFAISYEQLHPDDRCDALALRMLHAAAYCAPAPIPLELLWHVGEVADDTIEHMQQRDSALRRLRATGLITMESAGDPPMVLLHRLIAAYVRNLSAKITVLDTLIEALIETANDAVNSGYPYNSIPFLSHLQQVIFLQQSIEDAQLAHLLYTIARVHEQQRSYTEARYLYEQALTIYKQTLGHVHPSVAQCCTHLGMLLYHIGDLQTAQYHLEQALTICEQVLVPFAPEIAASLNNLGVLFQRLGELSKAKQFYERALRIKEQNLITDYPTLATSFNNLGNLLYTMRDLPAAQNYYARALHICKQQLGLSHPFTAVILDNLGALFQAIEDLSTAKAYYEEALNIREQALGPNHPDTAFSLNNLGTLLDHIGDWQTARSYYERALAIFEQELDPWHPNTATCLNNLGYLLQNRGELQEACLYYERALAINERVLGLSHPDTARSLNNLGMLLHALGKLQECHSYIERALAIREQTLGPLHPDTATSFNNMAVLLHTMGKIQAASSYLKRALMIFEQTFGLNHPTTNQCRADYHYLIQLLNEQQ